MFARTWSGLKRLLTKEQDELLSAASLLMIMGLITKITGMLYLQLFTRQFDLKTQADPYRLASVIPEYITDTILMGAIAGAIIPVFIRLRRDSGNDKFIKSFSSVFNLCLLVLLILTILTGIFADQLIPLAVKLARPEIPPSLEEMRRIAWMMRAMLVPQIILAVSGFVSTTLNIYKRFFVTQLANVFYNFGRIFAIIFVAEFMHGNIWSVIWGSWIAASLSLLVQLPLVWHLNIKIKLFYIDFRDTKLKEALSVGLPRILGLSVEEVRNAINAIIAFGLTPGAASTFDLAARLTSFPVAFLGVSFATASFTTLSQLYDQQEYEKFEQMVVQVINQVIFLSIPIGVTFIILRVPLVRLSYGLFKGELSWDETLKIAWIVLFTAIGLAFETMRTLMLRIYYATRNTWVPMLSSIGVVILGLTLSLLFSNYLSHFDGFSLGQLTWNSRYFFEKSDGAAGVGGLALASSLIYTLEFCLFLIGLKKLGVLNNLSGLAKSILTKLLAGIAMGVVMYMMAKLWNEVLNTTKTTQLALLTVTTFSASIVLYIWLSFIFKVPEVETFASFFYNKIRKYINY